MSARDPAPSGGGLAAALEAARLLSLGAAGTQLPTTLEQALYSQLLASGQLGDSLSALAAAGARQTHNPQLGAGLAGGSSGAAQPGGGGGDHHHHDDLVGSMGARAGGRTRSSDSRSSSAYASRHQAAEQRRRTRINER